MNIGEKIKNFREKEKMSVSDLAIKINDTEENILKYENNELEPSLDKKLAIAQALNLTLNDLSYNIEKNTLVNRVDEIEEDKEDQDFNTIDSDDFIEVTNDAIGKSTIIYDLNIFDRIFKREYTRYFIQSIISFFGYLIFGIYTFIYNLNIIAYLCFGISIYSFLKIFFTLFKYKAGKKAWILQYKEEEKTYFYYQNYIEIISSNEEKEDIRFNYTDIVRVIEKDGLIICMVNAPTNMIVALDKSKFEDDSLVKVKELIKNNCSDYVDIETKENSKKSLSKGQKVYSYLLWIVTIITILSLFISRLIFNLLNLDIILINDLLVYLVVLPLPVISIIMGIISKAKFSITSKKNIVVGIIMLVMCFLSMGMTTIQFRNYVNQNDEELIKVVKENTNTYFPSEYYYTVYLNSKQNDITFDDVKYHINTYQIWTFGRKKDQKLLKESIESSDDWHKSDTENKYDELITKFNQNEPSNISLAKADYYLMYMLSSDNYVLVAYYGSDNYLVAITFSYN